MPGIIVHEWLEAFGGAEKVVDAMTGVYPDADLYCLWNDAPGRYPAHRVIESPLASSPLRSRKIAALPVALATWRNLPYDDYDWALVSSHAFAHHARFRKQPDGFRKLVYVHTPARYIWNPELDHRGASAPVRAAAQALQPLDRRRAGEATSMAANSAYVRERIRRAWGRDAAVIHPPVEIERIVATNWEDALTAREGALLETLPEDFLLGASRFVPYKALELVIRSGEAARTPVVLAGSGPDEQRLRAIARTAAVPVHFVARPSDALLYCLYERAMAYVFPSVEDFGIMPIEAMALGTPVVCGTSGGVLETVADGVSGVHVADWSADPLATEIDRAVRLDPSGVRAHAQQFSRQAFDAHLAAWVGGAA